MDTKARKAAFLEALERSGGIVSTACKAVGISRQTFYDWRNTDKSFKHAAWEIGETQIDFVESRLLERIKEGDTTAMIFYLKTKGKARGYVEKTDITMTKKGDERLDGILAKYTDRQLDRIIDGLAGKD